MKLMEKSGTCHQILIIVDKFLTPITNYITNHVVGLLSQGIDISVIASQICIDNCDLELISPYPVLEKSLCFNITSRRDILLNCIKVILKSPFKTHIRTNLFKILINYNTELGLVHLLKSISFLKIIVPDKLGLVHCHSLISAYDYLDLKLSFNVPLVVTFHGLPTKNIRKLPLKKCQEVFAYADLFFVNTSFAEKQLQALGCNKKKISIVPQGTRVELFNYKKRKSIPEGQLNLMSLCRLSYDKGLKYAIDAVKDLRQKFPYIKYKIVGSGPQEDELRRIIENEDLVNNVILCGQLPFREVVNTFNWADIFILPSLKATDKDFHEETQAVVMQEAQASGVPVIATNVGGIPDCNVHGKTALLIQDRDSDAIVGAITRLKDDEILYNQLVIDGRLWVEQNFSLDQITTKILNEYLRLICQQ